MKQHLLGLSVFATSCLATMPQAALAQTAIPITGGNITVERLNDPAGTTATFITPQGSIDSSTTNIVSTNGWLNPCCSIVGHISGVGYSSNGPVVFSNLPFAVETIGGHAYLPIAGGARREIRGGMINGAYTDHSVPRARTMHQPGTSIMHNLPVQASPDLSSNGFSFEPLPQPAAAPAAPTAAEPAVIASNFEIPEFVTEPGNPKQQDRLTDEVVEIITISNGLQRPQRLNGIPSRIIPAWTPGLYQ